MVVGSSVEATNRYWATLLRLASLEFVGGVFGATVTAAIVLLLGRVLLPPEVVVGLLAGYAVLANIGLVGGFPESRFRVPKRWSRFGQNWYAVLFGISLGLGFVTAVPSPGFFVALVGGIGHGWLVALLVTLAYSLARMGIQLGSIFSMKPDGGQALYVRRWQPMADAARTLEIFVLSGLTAAALMQTLLAV